MPENDAFPKKISYEETFVDLIDASETRDLGIILFEQKMQALASRLTARSKEEYITPEEYEEEAGKLNEDWRYHQDVARISGRVYLIDESMVDFIPEDWGEPQTDEEGDSYYYLEDIQLRSCGIEVMPMFNDQGDTDSVRVAYVFTLQDDDEKEPLFNAYVGELARHEYEVPTPEEACARLERLWPEEYKLVDEIMRPDLQTALTRRLILLTRRFQAIMESSPKFTEYLTLAVNEKLALDRGLPYATMVKKGLRCYDGKDPLDPEDEGQWVDISISDELGLFIFEPKIAFEKHAEEIEAYVYGETYNDEGDEYAEFVSIEMANITSFRSTRAMRSLITRALMNETQNSLDSPQITAINEALESLNELKAEVNDEPEEKKPSTVPEAVKVMENLEAIFKEVTQVVSAHRMYLYRTQEEATEGCNDLLKTLVGKLFEAGVKNHYMYEFSGENAYRPKKAGDLPKIPHVFMYGIDMEEPVVPLQHGDSFTGYIQTVQPLTQARTNEEGEVVGYMVNPSLVVLASNEKYSAALYENISLVDISVDMKAMVPLDGSVEIKISNLEAYRRTRQALNEVVSAYGDRSRLVKQMHRLQAAFASGVGYLYQPLRDLNLLKKINKNIIFESEREKPIAPALSLLEELMVSRPVQLRGDILLRPEENEVNQQNALPPNEHLAGTIIDIEGDAITSPLMLVVQTANKDIKYIPINSLTEFKF